MRRSKFEDWEKMQIWADDNIPLLSLFDKIFDSQLDSQCCELYEIRENLEGGKVHRETYKRSPYE